MKPLFKYGDWKTKISPSDIQWAISVTNYGEQHGQFKAALRMARRIEKHINPSEALKTFKRLQRVKFRKFKEGDVIAIFLDWECPMSYQHHGQHGACSKNLRLRRATPAEYQDLLEELVKIGYTDLEVEK